MKPGKTEQRNEKEEKSREKMGGKRNPNRKERLCKKKVVPGPFTQERGGWTRVLLRKESGGKEKAAPRENPYLARGT